MPSCVPKARRSRSTCSFSKSRSKTTEFNLAAKARPGCDPRSALDQAVAHGVAHQVCGRMEPGLAHGRGAMALDGLEADPERRADVLVHVAFRDELDDGSLAGGQQFASRAVATRQIPA